MELIQEFSQFVWDEQIVSTILPYATNFVIRNVRSSESLIAMRLFCKLIGRIKYIPKPLANWSVFSVYVIPLRDYCLNCTQNMLKILIAKNFFKVINLAILFEVLTRRKVFASKMENDAKFSITDMNIEEMSDAIIEESKITEASQLFNPENGENLGGMISQMIKSKESLFNIQKDFPRIEGFLSLKDIRILLNYIGESLTSTHKETLKSTCLKAISGLMNRLEPREISKLNRFVVKVIETTSNPGTLSECLKLLKCFVKNNSEDKIMCAKILQKTVVLILHPCLRVNKTVNSLIE